MPMRDIPTDWRGTLTLSEATVPAGLIAPDSGIDIDRDGFACVDMDLAHGRISAVRPHNPSSTGTHQVALRRRMLWPTLRDLHTHLDKGHIWRRAPNTDGTHATAAATVARDRRANWSAEDVATRFEFALRCGWAHGTSAIRTHLDSYELAQARISWGVFETLRTRWVGRMDLQGVCMTRVDAYAGADGAALVDLTERAQGVLGGILRIVPPADPEAIDHYLDVLFAHARTRGLDIDLHIDETGDPAASGLRRVAQAALRNRFAGRVTCGHCCALSVQPEAVMRETIAMVRDANVTIVTLPMVNLYLQDRGQGRTPRWRGITPVQELQAAGIDVVAASDNCRDPFYMFGDLDMLETFREFVRIGQLDGTVGQWVNNVTTLPARVMGHGGASRLVPGAPADFIVFNARTADELLARPQSDRIVLRDGMAIDTTLPPYSMLDGLKGGA